MFGLSFWEITIIAIAGVLLCGVPVAVILTVMSMSASGRNHDSDERGT
jgi:hypothetical protein